jgi:hypothetical protein
VIDPNIGKPQGEIVSEAPVNGYLASIEQPCCGEFMDAGPDANNTSREW